MATPAPQPLDDGWTNNMHETPCVENDDFAQLLDEAGLRFDAPGGTLVRSSAEILPKRYVPHFVTFLHCSYESLSVNRGGRSVVLPMLVLYLVYG